MGSPITLEKKSLKDSRASSSELSSLSSTEDAKLVKSAVSKPSKKRQREDDGTSGLAKEKVKKQSGNKEKKEGVACHQCRRDFGPDACLSCTKLITIGKKERPCRHAFCDRDLASKYDVDATAVRTAGNTKAKGFDVASSYTFECPCCAGNCQTAKCRAKSGLPALHPKNLTRSAGDEGTRPDGNAKAAVAAVLHDDSDLSELESEAGSKPEKTAKVPKKKAVKGAKESKTKKTNGAGKKKAKTSGQAEGSGAKVNGKPRKSEGTTKKKEAQGKVKPKAKLAKKPEVVPEAPIFEKVATRLGHDEAQHRMALREFLWRFRQVLSLPERSLSALDDFDRPITEASVKLFAGAMMDIVKDELEGSNKDKDLAETIFNLREEVRYYADIVRFSAIFQTLSGPLGLRLPEAPIDRRTEANNAAIRALFDLDDKQAAPTWATELSVPSRRGASRVPQASEVVRMLLSFAERTLSTPKLRGNMELFSIETLARKKHASALKKETTAWEERKKKLLDARVLCKTAAETKSNRAQTVKEQKEHELRLSQSNVNLRAELSHASLRYEPLGKDVDGRLYYALSHQPVDNDTRPPVGWATGLLVWGPAVDGKLAEDDALHHSIDRWSHFGVSNDVKALVKWLEWKFKIASQEARKAVAKDKVPVNPKTEAPATSSKSIATPSKAVLEPTANKTPKRARSMSSLSSLSSDSLAEHIEDGSSTSSGLTPPPTTSKEDIMSLIDPIDYKPRVETLEETGKELVGRLNDVAEWLEVLEWKGLGEA